MIRSKALRIIISSIYWGKAVYFASNKNYEKGLYCIGVVEKYRITLGEEFYLLKSFLLLVSFRDKESLGCLKKSMEKINDSKFLNSDEKNI